MVWAIFVKTTLNCNGLKKRLLCRAGKKDQMIKSGKNYFIAAQKTFPWDALQNSP